MERGKKQSETGNDKPVTSLQLPLGIKSFRIKNEKCCFFCGCQLVGHEWFLRHSVSENVVKAEQVKLMTSSVWLFVDVEVQGFFGRGSTGRVC